MSYKHSEMPPTVVRTAEDQYELRGQSGVVIDTFDQSRMEHPNDWWSAMIDAMVTNYSSTEDLAHDLTLLSATGDWTTEDER